MGRGVTHLRRPATWLGLRSTPLRRRIDRIEIAARWAAVAVALVSLLVAPAAADAAGDALADQAAASGGPQHPGAADGVPTAAAQAEPTPVLLNEYGRPITTVRATANAAALSAGAGVATPLLGLGGGWLLLATTRRLLRRPTQRYWDRAWAAFNFERVRPGP